MGLLASQVALVVKNSPVDAGYIRHTGSISGWGRTLGEGNDTPLQYSCLENPMDREAWGSQSMGSRKESDRTDAT